MDYFAGLDVSVKRKAVEATACGTRRCASRGRAAGQLAAESRDQVVTNAAINQTSAVRAL